MEQEIETFLDYLKYERYYSIHTIQAYERDLRQFDTFIKQTGETPMSSITYQDIRLYIAHLNQQGLKRTSIRRKLSSIRAFFHYGMQQKWINEDPTSLIEYQVKEKKLPEYFYEEEMTDFITHVYQSKRPYPKRNIAIVELLYATGIRVSELCQLTINRIDLDIQMVRILGKGNKERIVPVGDIAIKALKAYLSSEREELNTNQRSEIFLTDKGKAMTRDNVSYLLAKLMEEAGLNQSISPHKFRHTFATHLLNHGADMRSVQELLGHADLTSTQIYTHVTKDSLRREYMKSFPRAKRQTKED